MDVFPHIYIYTSNHRLWNDTRSPDRPMMVQSKGLGRPGSGRQSWRRWIAEVDPLSKFQGDQRSGRLRIKWIAQG